MPDVPSDRHLPRRTVLQGLLAGLVFAPGRAPFLTEPSWIWSGAVTPTSATVIAGFLEPPPAQPLLLVDTARGLGNAQRVEGTATAAPSRRRDGRVIMEYRLEGLSPSTEYFTGFRPDSGTRARFRTFASGPFSFTAAFASCAGGTRVVPLSHVSNSGVFAAIAALDPHLFIHMGDFHYYNINGAPRSPAVVARFRRALDRVMAQEYQALLYRNTPLAYVWDDHDYGPDDADSRSGTRDSARAFYAVDVPHYRLPLSPAADGPIAQTFDIGRVRFVMTDVRSERLPTAGEMLGPRQKAWLLAELDRAAADRVPLVVWVNPVPWITADGDGDGWGRYASERREIGDRIAALGLGSRLLMLSGDAHMLAFDDGRNNRHGGFIVAQAAPLDRFLRHKGGPYSHEPPRQKNGQFGTLTVDDTGTTLTATLQGHRYLGNRRGSAPVPETRLQVQCSGGTCRLVTT